MLGAYLHLLSTFAHRHDPTRLDSIRPASSHSTDKTRYIVFSINETDVPQIPSSCEYIVLVCPMLPCVPVQYCPLLRSRCRVVLFVRVRMPTGSSASWLRLEMHCLLPFAEGKCEFRLHSPAPPSRLAGGQLHMSLDSTLSSRCRCPLSLALASPTWLSLFRSPRDARTQTPAHTPKPPPPRSKSLVSH